MILLVRWSSAASQAWAVKLEGQSTPTLPGVHMAQCSSRFPLTHSISYFPSSPLYLSLSEHLDAIGSEELLGPQGQLLRLRI